MREEIVPRQHIPGVRIRRLQSTDEAKLTALMLGMSEDDRRNRFLGNVGDISVTKYVSTLFDQAVVLDGAFAGEMLCGVAEFLPIPTSNVAEGAFVVNPQYRNRGIGTQLALAAIDTARKRGFGSLRMSFLRSNFAMRRLSQKIGARLTVSFDEMHGEVSTQPVGPRA